MEIGKRDGNGGIHLNYKFIGMILTVMVVFGGAITFASNNKSDIANNKVEIAELKEDSVSKENYERERELIWKKLDEMHTDIKNINKGGE